MERRVLGNFHIRLGPIIVGPIGLFQPFSDAIKLFCKREEVLRRIQKFYWAFSPFLSLVLYLFMLIGFPLGGGEFFLENIYLLLICFFRFSVYFLIYGGYHSGRKYSLIGRYRSVAQIISYEVILIFIFVSYFYVIIGWNLNFKNYLIERVNFYFSLPFFFIWLLVILVERNRLPYDFLEGESELVSGFNTEFWGGYFSFLFIYEYGAILLFAILTGYFLFRGYISFVFFSLVMYFFLWIRSTAPRFRYDFLMDLAWKKILFLVIGILIYFVFL